MVKNRTILRKFQRNSSENRAILGNGKRLKKQEKLYFNILF